MKMIIKNGRSLACVLIADIREARTAAFSISFNVLTAISTGDPIQSSDAPTETQTPPTALPRGYNLSRNHSFLDQLQRQAARAYESAPADEGGECNSHEKGYKAYDQEPFDHDCSPRAFSIPVIRHEPASNSREP